MKKVLSFILNGDPVEVLCEDNRSLLDLIRDDLGLTGTKKGCEEAECGACTVMIDGRPVNSCATLAREVEGCEVITVEGVAKNGQLTPLQKQFMMAPNMLHAKVKHSPYPRARILSIDTSRAEALPGVKGVLTGKDFPIRITEDIEILCQKEVRMVGDPVVAVCAISEEIAEEALDLIDVEYEEMEAVFDPLKALEDGAPDVQGYGYDNHNIGPTCHQVGTNDGKDIDEEFEKAAYVHHADFKTHRIQHAPIEPHATFAQYDPEKDEWTVYQSTTMSFGDQFWLAHGFQKDVSHFHVIRPYVGGAFGSKSNWPYSEFIACEFARRTLRPVRFVQTREEEFSTMHGRHPFLIHIDTAFDKDGRILAKKADQILDGGAYGVSHSQFAAVNLSALWCAFPYKIDAIDFRSRRVLTNTAEGGAMRGYTACQVQFAHDLNMQYASEAMGIDPIEFRKRSAMEPGYHYPAGLIVTSCDFKKTLDDAAKAMRWEERKDKLKPGEGIGFAGTAFVSGTASPVLNSPNQVQTNATVRVDLHGVVSLMSNCHDNGQGADTVMTAIVAEELGLDMNEVKLLQPSTFNAGYGGDFDVLFMDIEMPRMDGLETARRIRKVDQKVCIIFMTNMARYALQGYEVDAVDFVVKPVGYFALLYVPLLFPLFCTAFCGGNLFRRPCAQTGPFYPASDLSAGAVFRCGVWLCGAVPNFTWKSLRTLHPPLCVNANQKMSIFAEMECHFSAVSIAVYTALIHHFTCRLEARQALIYQLALGLTGRKKRGERGRRCKKGGKEETTTL